MFINALKIAIGVSVDSNAVLVCIIFFNPAKTLRISIQVQLANASVFGINVVEIKMTAVAGLTCLELKFVRLKNPVII